MGKLVVTEFITLDGVIEDPGGSENLDRGGWAFHLTWDNSTRIDGDVAEEVAKLKEQVAGEILVAGSATLVRTLVEHDLVDELRLMVFPTVLGGGKRLFGDSASAKAFRLVESRPVGGDGVVILTYEPAKS